MPGRTDGRGLADLIRALARIDGLRAHPLHDQPSRRHDRRADRRARRGRQADALPPPAGAVGQQPNPQGDEPQPHRRKLSSHVGEDARCPRPTSRFPATSSSAFPARPTRISRRRSGSSTRCATPRLIRSSTAPARALRRPPWRTRFRARSWTSGCSGCRSGSTAHQLAFNRSNSGREHADPDRAQGQAPRPDDRPLAVAAVGACRSRRASPATSSTSRSSRPVPTA